MDKDKVIHEIACGEYQTLAERTSATSTVDGCAMVNSRIDARNTRLLHAGMGMATESGEFLDGLKKTIFYGKPLDIVNLQEEIGDLLWYIAEACNSMDINILTLMVRNIEKLQARYPDKFSSEKAMNRDLQKEREILEAGN